MKLTQLTYGIFLSWFFYSGAVADIEISKTDEMLLQNPLSAGNFSKEVVIDSGVSDSKIHKPLSRELPSEIYIEVKIENPLNIKPNEISVINMTVTLIREVPVSNASLKLYAIYDKTLKRIRMRSAAITFNHDGGHTTVPLSGFVIDENGYVGVMPLCEQKYQYGCLSYKLMKTTAPMKLITKSPIDLNRVSFLNNQFSFQEISSRTKSSF